MMILITYDVSLVTDSGKKRLRKISEACLNYGMRVQNSVFECEVTPVQWITLKAKLLSVYNPKTDSLRFYFLGSSWRRKVEHAGAKPSSDILKDPLIL